MSDDWKRQRLYERLMFWLLVMPLAISAVALVVGFAYLYFAFRQ